MRVPYVQRLIVYLELFAVSLLCAAFLLPLDAKPRVARAPLAQPTRARPTSTSRPFTPTPTWTPAPPTPTVPTPTPTRRPPTSTPTATHTPTSTPTPTVTPNVLATLIARPMEATPGQKVAVPLGRLSLAFAQLGYGIVEMNGGRPAQLYTVALPGSFEIAQRGNYLLLALHYFVASLEEPAALEVAVNGSAVHAIVLEERVLTSRTIHIDIPGGLLRVGRNLVELKLTAGASCEAAGNIANVWVDDTSRLELRYNLVPYAPDLSLYPYPFAEESVLRIPTTIVLADRPTTAELSAAVGIAAGLGKGSGGMIELHAVRAGDFDPALHGHHHLIVIGQAGNNPLLEEVALPPEIAQDAAKPGQGVLGLAPSPWDVYRLALVVSALDGEGMAKASQALETEVPFLPGRVSVAAFRELRTMAGETETPRWPLMAFSSLNYEDVFLYGTQPHDRLYDFALPLGWPLDQPALLVLRFAHSRLLDPNRSVISVRLNGEPVGSVPLSLDSGTDGEVGVQLPVSVLQPGRNHLQISVAMGLPGVGRSGCGHRDDEQVWTAIGADSQIIVPDTATDGLKTLSRFPYPFGRTTEPNPTLFVLPDEPSQAVLDQAVELAARIGSPVMTGHAACHAIYASALSPALSQGRHVILLGTWSENVVVQELAPHLPALWADKEVLVTGDTRVQLTQDRDWGILEITGSPWHPAYGLLVVSGTSEEGVSLAVRALVAERGSLVGDVAVIGRGSVAPDEAGEALAIQALDSGTRAPIPDTMTGMDPRVRVRLAERWWH